MGLKADLADMAASIDEELGEPATWSGVAGEVRVHFDAEDQVFGFGEGRAVDRARRITVHRAQVPEPQPGHVCQLLESGEMLRVIADSTPLLDRDGYWLCEVDAVQP